MSDIEKEISRMDFEFMMWLQCDAGIDTLEKYEALSEKEYLELKKEFLKWFGTATAIKVGGSNE